MPWSFLFDIVHHRRQITTYLRSMGSMVPQIRTERRRAVIHTSIPRTRTESMVVS